jgi:putative membrane protein
MNGNSGGGSAGEPGKGERAAPPVATGSSMRAIGRGLAAAMGVGPRPGTVERHMDQGTLLAIERSYLAADRTLMAWIRTALSMIGFGFTLGKLGQTVSEIEMKGALRGVRMVSVESVAYFLVIIGTGALFAALLQYLISIAEYAELGVRHRVSIAFVVGAVLVAVGAFAFTALVMQL